MLPSSFGLAARPPSFVRRWRVTVNTIEITELDVAFKIEKSLKDEPNTCELHVWNLNETQRAQIEELNPTVGTVSALAAAKAKTAVRQQATKGIPVRIEAGYEDEGDLSLLWLGDLRSAHSLRDGPHWVTVLESGDGEKAWQNARMNVSFGPKTPVDTALRAMVRALGIGQGNLEQIVHKLKVGGMGKLFPRGTVFSGPVQRELRDFARSADIEFSIQDGTLQIIDAGKALAESAILVSSETGMLESPTVDIDGILTVKMLMQPGIRPGRLLVVDADRIKGNYRAERITWEADSAGDSWSVEIEASRL